MLNCVIFIIRILDLYIKLLSIDLLASNKNRIVAENSSESDYCTFMLIDSDRFCESVQLEKVPFFSSCRKKVIGQIDDFISRFSRIV